MFNPLSTSRCGLIGLDVGAEGVRMLQLDRAGGRMSVAAAGRWSFPAGALGTGADRQERRRLAGQAVRDMLKKGGFRGRNAVSCLRADELAVKNVRLPRMSDRELSSAVLYECHERFGFEVVPDRVHYVNAGEVRQGTESRDEIVLMAVTEDVIRQHVEMLDEMRLKCVHIDAEPMALFRTYQRFLRRAEDELAVTVVADIGLSATKVVVARGKTIVLVKTIDVAGHALNQSVARELGLSYTEAQHLRRRALEGHAAEGPEGGIASDDQVQWSVLDAIRGQAEALAAEIGLCLRYCSVTFRGLRPAQITLTGGEAYDPALVKLLSENLDCQCAVGEPLRGIDRREVDLCGDRRGVLAEWSVATGLALRGLSGRSEIRKTDHERSRVPA